MSFAEVQKNINEGWKQKSKPVEAEKVRDKGLCPKCGKEGFKVKMDFMKDCYTIMKMARYKVDIYGCPRCHFLDKRFARIEGKGKSGVDLGKTYGQL